MGVGVFFFCVFTVAFFLGHLSFSFWFFILSFEGDANTTPRRPQNTRHETQPHKTLWSSLTLSPGCGWPENHHNH